MIDIKRPNISSATDAGKVEQIRSYLFQLVDQLQWALNYLESGATNVLQQSNQSAAKKASDTEAQATFNSIKSLIISSADIIHAYYEEMRKIYANHIASIDAYSGKDFNELIYKTGYYTGTSAPSSVSCTNYPIDETGLLEVISAMAQNKTTLAWWGFAYQTYRTHTGNVYMRSYYSATGWTAWKKVAYT